MCHHWEIGEVWHLTASSKVMDSFTFLFMGKTVNVRQIEYIHCFDFTAETLHFFYIALENLLSDLTHTNMKMFIS